MIFFFTLIVREYLFVKSRQGSTSEQKKRDGDVLDLRNVCESVCKIFRA